MLSFMDARGGGTSLWSSTLIAPVGILFRHCGGVGLLGRARVCDGLYNAYLLDNPQTLSELLDTAQVPIIRVPVCPNRDIKLDLTQHQPPVRPLTENSTQGRARLTSSYLSYGATFLRSQGTPEPLSITPVNE